MTVKAILDAVNESQSLLAFSYKGKDGNIDPYYSPAEGHSWLLYYDGEETVVHSEEAVLKTPFIAGMTLEEAAPNLVDVEW